MNPPSAVLGGGVHGKVSWLIAYMTTILDTVVLFISQLGEVKRSTAFSFHGINIWNQLKMHIPTDVSHICFKKLTLSYLIANDIVYRIKS